MWAKQVGTSDAVESLTLDTSGNSYVTGILQGRSSFAGINTTLTSKGSTDVFVAKLDASGNAAWAISFGGTGLDWGNGIAVDGSGNVYVAGYFADTVNFNPDPLGTPDYLTSAGTSDMFLLKLKQSEDYQCGGRGRRVASKFRPDFGNRRAQRTTFPVVWNT